MIRQKTLLHNSACETCPAAQLTRLGVKTGSWDYIIALAGNPNTGKSTVFNALTGLHQHTGNWPGKTVTRMEGSFKFADHTYKIVDLPGTYSLLATSEDEEVARDFILFGQPHVTVVVVDATRLERNLNLAMQVIEITDRVVIALNLMDEAKRHGIDINHKQLARELGVPVIPMVARQNEGINDLIAAVAEVATGKRVNNPKQVKVNDPAFNKAVDQIANQLLSTYPGLPAARWVALRLLDGDERITEAVNKSELLDLVEAQTLRQSAIIPLEVAVA